LVLVLALGACGRLGFASLGDGGMGDARDDAQDAC